MKRSNRGETRDEVSTKVRDEEDRGEAGPTKFGAKLAIFITMLK
jgi:hypothetical protein